MSNGQHYHTAEKIASNAWFMLIGRSAMILMIPLLGFVGTNLISLNTRVEVLTVTVETQRAAMQTQLSSRYTSADAARDNRLLQIQIDELGRRVRGLERANERNGSKGPQ